MEIKLKKYQDKFTIDKLILDEELSIVYSQFFRNGDEVITVDASSWSTSDQNALKRVIDLLTWSNCANSVIWKVVRNDKEFDLGESYIRSNVDSNDSDKLLNGTPLKVRFETPGFNSYNTRIIDLWYNQVFNPSDIDLLSEMGITISGNGRLFQINNDVECRVSFQVPSIGGPYNYVICDDDSQIILMP